MNGSNGNFLRRPSESFHTARRPSSVLDIVHLTDSNNERGEEAEDVSEELAGELLLRQAAAGGDGGSSVVSKELVIDLATQKKKLQKQNSLLNIE